MCQIAQIRSDFKEPIFETFKVDCKFGSRMFAEIEDFINEWFGATYKFEDFSDVTSGNCVKSCLYVSLDYAGFNTTTFDVFNGTTESYNGIRYRERSSVGVSIVAENVGIFYHVGNPLSQTNVTESI